MLVSVVIPAAGGRRLLADCLPSLCAATDSLPADAVETILVDCGLGSSVVATVKESWPSVKVLTLSGVPAFARAANRGAAAADGDWVAFLSDDAAAEAEWLSAARLDRRSSEIGAVASKIVSWDRTEVRSAGGAYRGPGRADGSEPGGTNGAGRVFAADATAAFYRRDAFWDVGGFDERLGRGCEDLDLAFRLNLRGWLTVYEPECVSRCRRAAPGASLAVGGVKDRARNSEVTFFSCMPSDLLVRTLPAHLRSIAAEAVASVGSGALLPFLSGKAQFLGRLGSVRTRRKLLQRRRLAASCDLSALIAPAAASSASVADATVETA